MAKTTDKPAEELEQTTPLEVPAEAEGEQEEKLITIRLPIIKENNADVFVRVNHRTWLIKRGETVQVPECVVEVLNNAEKAQLEAFEFEQKATRKVKKDDN